MRLREKQYYLWQNTSNAEKASPLQSCPLHAERSFHLKASLSNAIKIVCRKQQLSWPVSFLIASFQWPWSIVQSVNMVEKKRSQWGIYLPLGGTWKHATKYLFLTQELTDHCVFFSCFSLCGGELGWKDVQKRWKPKEDIGQGELHFLPAKKEGEQQCFRSNWGVGKGRRQGVSNCSPLRIQNWDLQVLPGIYQVLHIIFEMAWNINFLSS